MVPCDEPMLPSAPYKALVMQDEVSTLPATTAAGYRGLSMEPSGMTMFNGFRQPALSGISSSTNGRNTYRTAAVQTAEGALKLLDCCGDVPVKSIQALRFAASTRIDTAMTAPLSSRYSKCPFLSFAMTRRTASSALSCTYLM